MLAKGLPYATEYLAADKRLALGFSLWSPSHNEMVVLPSAKRLFGDSRL